jgi:hypothetical protein
MVVLNPAFDVWVWLALLLFLIVVGARAWVVETGQGRLGRTPVKVKLLTATSVLVLGGLLTLVAMQGGYLLVQSLITGTNPSTAVYGPSSDPNAPADPKAPANPPADPNAPAGNPAAPPAGNPAAPPAGNPAAPPAGNPAAPPAG